MTWQRIVPMTQRKIMTRIHSTEWLARCFTQTPPISWNPMMRLHNVSCTCWSPVKNASREIVWNRVNSSRSHEDPALSGDMSDPYADGNGSKILPMFDPYADGKPKIWLHVRSKLDTEMAGRQWCPILNLYICRIFVPLSTESRAEYFLIELSNLWLHFWTFIQHCLLQFRILERCSASHHEYTS